jgi:hypothetical protein
VVDDVDFAREWQATVRSTAMPMSRRFPLAPTTMESYHEGESGYLIGF